MDRVDGTFSAADEHEILRIAQSKWQSYRQSLDDDLAREQLTREFVEQAYWGFQPQRPTESRPLNLGVKLIVLCFLLFTFGLMATVWLGQNYSDSGEPGDLAWLLVVVSVIVVVFGGFLWRHAKSDAPS